MQRGPERDSGSKDCSQLVTEKTLCRTGNRQKSAAVGCFSLAKFLDMGTISVWETLEIANTSDCYLH